MTSKPLRPAAQRSSNADAQFSHQDYLDALEQFDALLRTTESRESDWQRLFADHPYILSEALPLRVHPSQVRPLGRPGKSEADFAIVPSVDDHTSPAALVELKPPSRAVFREYRSGVLNLSAEASGAVRQVQHYAKSFNWPDRVVGFGNDRFLFVIIGLMSNEARRISVDLITAQGRGLLPSGVGLLTFDQIFQAFESNLRRRAPKIITLTRSSLGSRPVDFLDQIRHVRIGVDGMEHTTELVGSDLPFLRQMLHHGISESAHGDIYDDESRFYFRAAAVNDLCRDLWHEKSADVTGDSIVYSYHYHAIDEDWSWDTTLRWSVEIGLFEGRASLRQGKLHIDEHRFTKQREVIAGEKFGGKYIEPDDDIESVIRNAYEKNLR